MDYTICFSTDWILIPLCFIGGMVTPVIIIAVIQDWKRQRKQ